MTVIWGIIVIFVLAICFRPKKDAVPKTENNPASDQNPYDMVWPEPKPDNLWDSFDYFVRIGEVWTRYASDSDENTVYLRYVVKDIDQYCKQHAGERGYFELDMSELSWAKDYLRDVPYIQTIDPKFIGYDPASTILSMEEQRIRINIIDEAPHAAIINTQSHKISDGEIVSIDVKFHGLHSH